jgi:hypothetical protein
MDINFHDPSDIPLPPEEVRIRELRAEPLPDQRRVRIYIEITPFQQKPNCEIKVLNEAGSLAASLSIIEAIDYKMEFTVHLKVEQPSGEYIVSLDVYYFEEQGSKQDPDFQAGGETHQLPERVKPVDQRQVAFTIMDQQDAA